MQPGARLGRYEITETIGHGSFGIVYVARDTELDREVALKILKPSHRKDRDAMHRFLREARAAARVAHPGIVIVHDCGGFTPEGMGEDTLAFIAMERLHGESLADRLERVGRLAPAEAIEIARQVASALEAAHRADVLHRDLKPDNIFLVAEPEIVAGERVKVLDFGFAKIGSTRHTQLGSVFGTPHYMAPEQCRSSDRTDRRGDVYALGCVLFELLTGLVPFEGKPHQVLERHQREPAPRVASLFPAVPPRLDELVARMLEKDPAARPPTMAAVIDELAAALEPAALEPATLEPAALEPAALEPAAAEPAALEPDSSTLLRLDDALTVGLGAAAALAPAMQIAPAARGARGARAHAWRQRMMLLASVVVGMAVAAAVLLATA